MWWTIWWLLLFAWNIQWQIVVKLFVEETADCTPVTWAHTIRVSIFFYDKLCLSSDISSSFTGATACSWPRCCKWVLGQMSALSRAACVILLTRKRREDLDLHRALMRSKDLQRGRVLLGWFVQKQSVLLIHKLVSLCFWQE